MGKIKCYWITIPYCAHFCDIKLMGPEMKDPSKDLVGHLWFPADKKKEAEYILKNLKKYIAKISHVEGKTEFEWLNKWRQ